MGSFFAELKRRQMFRVAAAYAVLAWLLLQVVNNVAPVLMLPPWVQRAFLLALVIGFPFAMFFAWMRELAPIDAGTPRAATSKLDYALIGALVLVLALLSYQQLAPGPRSNVTQQASVAAAASQPQAQTGGISIAVLPFANLSGDASQEFFSDGTSEEITAALAKVPGLRVVGRSSAFQFKGQNRDLRAIGQALNARYLIDGSVRQAGNRVRITAQLIQADDGIGLWTENYDRELTDIFAIQEDIAQAIAGALRVPLGLEQGQQLVTNRPSDVDSYRQYLRARALFRARDIEEAIRVLEAVVAREPGYGPAWGLLSRAYRLSATFSGIYLTGTIEEIRRVQQAADEKGERAAHQAIRLDPKHPLAYLSLAYAEAEQGRKAAAEDLLRQALALDPTDPEVLDSYRQFLDSHAGRATEALRLSEQLRTLEPFVPIYNITAAAILRHNRKEPEAIGILEGIRPDMIASFGRHVTLAQAYAAQGRYSEAADTLLLFRSENPTVQRSVEDAARLLRTAPATVASNGLPEFRAALEFVYFHIGAPDRIFENHERTLEILPGNSIGRLWAPEYAPLRKTERFKALARRGGYVDYWRARGWPDLCRPVGADDFVCD